MGNLEVAKIIERMMRKRLIKDASLSAYINMLLGARRIGEVYELLTKENMVILLRSIVKQYKNYFNKDFLELEYFIKIVKERDLEEKMIINLFNACMQEKSMLEHRKACITFVETCDLLIKYQYGN